MGAGNRRAEMVLNRGDERYVFRYEVGQEERLLDALVAAAKNPRLSFDWFDAAVLSFELTQGLIGRAEQILES